MDTRVLTPRERGALLEPPETESSFFTPDGVLTLTVPGIDPDAVVDTSGAISWVAGLDQRLGQRARKICDEYLQGALLTLPRVTINGPYNADRSHTPVAQASVGLIICKNIERHAAPWADIFAEIKQMLAPGGVAYFTAPDREQTIDPHYHLPYLSALPDSLARFWLMMSLRGDAPLFRPISPSEIQLLAGDCSLANYSGKEIPGAPGPIPGMLEYFLVKTL